MAEVWIHRDVQPHRLLLAAIFGLFASVLSAAPAWRPIPPEDLAAVPPPSEPAANGLILLREISVDSSDNQGTDFEYYLRFKVFTAAGVETLNKTEIPFARECPPRRLAARVVKPDGRSIEVAPEAVFTRDVVKAGGETISAKTFAFGALEPGDIAEYRYRISNPEIVAGMRFYLDHAFPTALVRIRIGLIAYPGYGLQSLWSRSAGFLDLSNGRTDKLLFEARGLASAINEPFPPPDDAVKPWFLFYYTTSDGTAQKYWAYTGGELQALTDAYLAPKKRVKETVAKLLADAPGEDEAIGRLYEFCRTQIKNLSYEDSGYTPDQIEKLKFNKSSTDTLTNGYGTAAQINMLFGALLRASGRSPYLAYCGDRSLSFFDFQLKTRSALPHLVVATKNGANWKFYDPGARYLAPGKLDWKNERTTALAVADKYWQMVETPSSEAAYSTVRRTAHFALAADGTLEGDVALVLEGHPGFAAKRRFGAKSASAAADLIKEDLVARLGQIEVTGAKVELPANLDVPITLSAHVRIADYAGVAGDRLLVPLAFFQKGVPETFSATTRKSNIYFPYFLREEDKITFTLPSGYEMEPPGVFTPIDSGDRIHYSGRLDLAEDGRRVVYERSFIRRLFQVPQASYPVLQHEYQRIAAQDARTLSLRRTELPAGAPATQ